MSYYPDNIEDWPEFKIYDRDCRIDLLNLANSITRLKLWEWLKEFNPKKDEGFMFTNNNNLNMIASDPVNSGHSGASFAYSMRIMEKIAKEGFNNLK